MESQRNVIFEALTAEVIDSLPADRWAVARITASLVQADPDRWPVLPGEVDLREGRFGCCRMTYTVKSGTVEIEGIGWVESHEVFR
ncbi:hypothetical protein [Streptacidiphilus cavernicola]|uniref:Cytotoxic translational repressor of toxin-antitoxin stability system n=1 Tax=Streptacidiphilus cavernicola TaxID=3342716 RepID=A0ABV6VNG4_9ACTN